MEILIEATDKLIHIDGIPVRLWEGTTANGVKCKVFVHRIAANSEDQSQFDLELKEQLAPGRVIDLNGLLSDELASLRKKRDALSEIIERMEAMS